MATLPCPDTLPDAEKDAKWIARKGYAFLQEAKTGGLFAAQSWGARSLDELNAYAEGRQSTTSAGRYKTAPNRRSHDATGAMGELNLDSAGILAVAPSFEAQYCSVLASQSVTVTVSAYDVQPDGELSPTAQAARQAAEVLRQQPLLGQLGLDPKAVLDERVPALAGEPMPVDEAHARYQVRRRVKDPDTSKLQGDINQAFDKLAVQQTLEVIGRNFFRQNAGALYVPLAAPHTPRYIAPHNLVALPSATDTFADAHAMGHYELLTIGELKQQIRACDERATKSAAAAARKRKDKAPDPVRSLPDETEWRGLALAAGWVDTGNGVETLARGTDTTATLPYDGHRVKVLRFYVKSFSDEKLRVGTSAKGLRFARRGKSAGTEGDEKSAAVAGLYTGLLVPDKTRQNGEPMAFACEKAHNQLRDPWLPGETLLPYAAARLPGLSPLQRMLPVLDDIQYAYRRLHQDLIRVVPANWMVNVAGMADIALSGGADGVKVSPQDIMAAFFETGLGIENTDPDPDSPNQTPRPPTFRYNGAEVPPTVMGWLQQIQVGEQRLQQITGLNTVTMGADPASRERLGKAGGEQALAASQRALGPELRLSGWLFRRTATLLALAFAGDYKMRKAHQTRCDVGPTEDAWARLYARADKALDAGLITYADVVALEEMADLAEAKEYFAVREKEVRQQQEQQAQSQSQQNADVQTQSAQAKAQADQQTLQMQHELRMAQLEYERETALLRDGARESAATGRTIIQTTGQVDQLAEKNAHDGAKLLAQQVDTIVREEAQRDFEAQQAAAAAAQQAAPPMEPQPVMA